MRERRQAPEKASARFLYRTLPGRMLLWAVVRPWVSRLAGWLLDRRLSAGLIPPFVRKSGIVAEDYEPGPYATFNSFFCRHIRAEKRPVDRDENALIAPCDASLSVYPIDDEACFTVKDTPYTMETLTRSKELAEKYRGGWLCLFRLGVGDYHRYVFPADGVPAAGERIPGVLHTVHPVAAAARPIYKENTREYMALHTEVFGDLLMMEVGALLVGKIVNGPLPEKAVRGAEKGYFAYGGSTIILCTEKGRFIPDGEFLTNTAEGYETIVRMGETIGYAAANHREPDTAGGPV